MEPDTTFTRRVCAMLLDDVGSFSTLMNEGDERTARVDHPQAIVGDAINIAARSRARLSHQEGRGRARDEGGGHNLGTVVRLGPPFRSDWRR